MFYIYLYLKFSDTKALRNCVILSETCLFYPLMNYAIKPYLYQGEFYILFFTKRTNQVQSKLNKVILKIKKGFCINNNNFESGF